MTFFLLFTWSLIAVLALGGAVYAPAELITTMALWLLQVAVLALLYNKKSSPYYGQEAAS